MCAWRLRTLRADHGRTFYVSKCTPKRKRRKKDAPRAREARQGMRAVRVGMPVDRRMIREEWVEMQRARRQMSVDARWEWR